MLLLLLLLVPRHDHYTIRSAVQTVVCNDFACTVFRCVADLFCCVVGVLDL